MNENTKAKMKKSLKIGEDDSVKYEVALEEQKSIVSHYIHNYGCGYSKNYEEQAKSLIKDIYDCDIDNEMKSCVSEGDVFYTLFNEYLSVPFLPVEHPKFTFIDLFAGIGGFRMAMQNLGGKCVFSSEWDAQAQKTYLLNYGEVPFGDITKESVKSYIPDNFDVLCAGFPCQAFSLAGKRLGFEEEERWSERALPTGAKRGIRNPRRRMAGMAGLEPASEGVKVPCLTTWLHPCIKERPKAKGRSRRSDLYALRSKWGG